MISIAMPYWQRPEELSRSLAAYRKVYPHLNLEFSICDDGSSPPLSHTSFGAYAHQVQLDSLPLKSVAKNPCVPINHAVRNCTNDIIVLTNPETEHRERVLDQMLAALTGPNDYVIAACRDTTHGEWFAGEGRSMKGALAPPGIQYHFCVMFHRALFERIGGFDEDYRDGHGYDDNDWAWRLHAAGDVNVRYVPGIVWHCRRLMQRSLWRGPQLLRNEALLRKKWGHLKEFGPCA